VHYATPYGHKPRRWIIALFTGLCVHDNTLTVNIACLLVGVPDAITLRSVGKRCWRLRWRRCTLQSAFRSCPTPRLYWLSATSLLTIRWTDERDMPACRSISRRLWWLCYCVFLHEWARQTKYRSLYTGKLFEHSETRYTHGTVLGSELT